MQPQAHGSSATLRASAAQMRAMPSTEVVAPSTPLPPAAGLAPNMFTHKRDIGDVAASGADLADAQPESGPIEEEYVDWGGAPVSSQTGSQQGSRPGSAPGSRIVQRAGGLPANSRQKAGDSIAAFRASAGPAAAAAQGRASRALDPEAHSSPPRGSAFATAASSQRASSRYQEPSMSGLVGTGPAPPHRQASFHSAAAPSDSRVRSSAHDGVAQAPHASTAASHLQQRPGAALQQAARPSSPPMQAALLPASAQAPLGGRNAHRPSASWSSASLTPSPPQQSTLATAQSLGDPRALPARMQPIPEDTHEARSSRISYPEANLGAILGPAQPRPQAQAGSPGPQALQELRKDLDSPRQVAEPGYTAVAKPAEGACYCQHDARCTDSLLAPQMYVEILTVE